MLFECRKKICLPSQAKPSQASSQNKNQLYYGDNLDILRKKIPSESVDLCYIDPPFNSKRNYFQIYNNQGADDKAQAQAFEDTWEWGDEAKSGFDYITDVEHLNSGKFTIQTVELIKGLDKVLGRGALFAYIVHMTLRIVEIHRVLKPTGSFYLHCDPTASHYLKLVLDSVFCGQGGDFKSEIIWRRTGAHNKSKRWTPVHDVILFYTKGNRFVWNVPRSPYMIGHVHEYLVRSENGEYRTDYYGNVLTGSGTRNGESGLPWKGYDPTVKGRHWAIPGQIWEQVDIDPVGLTQHQKLDKLYEVGAIKIDVNAAWPIYELTVDPKKGPIVSDIWAYQPYTENTVFGTKTGIDADIRWLSPKDAERLGYPTQKPEGLLERIIQTSSNQGDVVLDAYCGCGTSVAVAQRLNRKWIGIDITYQSISLILKRFEDTFKEIRDEVLDNIHLDGVPKDMASAQALAHRNDDKTRKEFEKWAVLTFSKNQARINEKKGGDGGVDGIAFFSRVFDLGKSDLGRVLISVKSDKTVTPNKVDELVGTMAREGADIGYLICLNKPSDGVYKRAFANGKYKHPNVSREDDKIQIITAEEILDGKRFDLPMARTDTVKSAKAVSIDQAKLL